MRGPLATVRRREFVVGAAAACLTCGACESGGDVAPNTAEASTTSVAPTTDAGLDPPAGGFGSTIDVGPVDEVRASIASGGGFRYVPEARAYLVAFPEQALDDARAVYDEVTVAGMELGFVALHQKCTHLGCRVPECTTSGRFECPCHGAIFSHVGEYVDGPAPRGLDRFAVNIVEGRVVIDTSTPLDGAPIGTRTVDDDPDAVPCIEVS